MKNTEQKKQRKTISTMLLGKILTITVIILICLISFVGIYVVDKNNMRNILPEYILGMDINGARNIKINVNKDTTTVMYDENGNIVENEEEDDDENTDKTITEVEEPINKEEVLTLDNYKITKNIIESRLKYMEVNNYLIRLDETDGTIYLEIPEDNATDYVAQYCITKGEFKISDTETGEILLTNSDIKEVAVQYGSSTSGTTVYLSIQFNKEGTEKLKEISNKYVASEDSEGNDTTKKIDMTIDDQKILSSYFEEEISNGVLQISIGTSTDSTTLQNYLQQASNMSVLLNTDPMPIVYEMEINRFVYSDITSETIIKLIIIFAVITVIFGIYMIVRYKAKGILGIISSLGFCAILLLLVRLGNVTISLSGLFTIAMVSIIEYVIITLILKVKHENSESEKIKNEMIALMKKTIITLIPLAIIAVTFALTSWEEIASIGMIMFWGMLVMIIYNILILGMIIFNPSNKKKNIVKQ